MYTSNEERMHNLVQRIGYLTHWANWKFEGHQNFVYSKKYHK